MQTDDFGIVCLGRSATFFAMVLKCVLPMLLVCLLSPVVGEEEEAGKDALAEAIQPRVEGAVWRFRSVEYEDGKEVKVGMSSEKVVRVLEIEGVRCYRVAQSWDYRTLLQRMTGLAADEAGVTYFWEYLDERGSHHFDEDFDEPAPPESLDDFVLSLKYPVKKGESYVIDDMRYKVLETDRKLAVRAGEFTCVVYEVVTVIEDHPEFSTRERLFQAAGVGLVRWEMDVKNDKGEWVLESRDDLLAYTLEEK